MGSKNLISVVDDDQSMTKMLSRVLSSAGFEVAVFHSAEEFLLAAGMTETLCIVLDIDLPGMSGLDLQRRLKEIGQNVPILFVSGQATDQIRQQALNSGALSFLNKPFSIAELLKAIDSVAPLVEPLVLN